MRFTRTLCATVGLLALGSTAFAQTDYHYDHNQGDYFNISFKKYGTASTFESGLAYVGSFTATVPGSIPPISPFTVYCVDLENNVVNPTSAFAKAVTVGPGSPAGQYDPTQIGGTYEMLQNAAYMINNAPTDGLGNSLLVGSIGDQNAALQVAIWEVIEGDSVYDIHSGDFSISGENSFVDINANLYLTALYNSIHDLTPGSAKGKGDGVLYQVDRATMGTRGQDMLGGHGSPGPNDFPSTPEGSSLLLLLPGLIPVAVGLRRRRRNAPVGE